MTEPIIKTFNEKLNLNNSSTKFNQAKSTNEKIEMNELLFDKKHYLNYLPDELDISIECIADLRSDENYEKYALLEEKYLELKNENEKLRKENDKLTNKLNCVTNNLNNHKQLNNELARNLQMAKVKIRDNQLNYDELNRDFCKQHDLYNRYHLAHLNLSNFIDLLVIKLTEFDDSLNMICCNTFADFDGLNNEIKLNTISHENIFVVASYLKRIQLKIDNLLLKSLD